MAVIKSGASSDQLTIDATSKAGRVTLYDTAGAVISTVSTSPRTSRTAALVYSHSMVDLAGQTAAYVFWALSNPAASGKRIALLRVYYTAYSVAAVTTKNSWSLMHCTAEASVGADDSANIHRVLSTQDAPVAVVRITAPTVTVGKMIRPFPSGGAITAAGIFSAPEIIYAPDAEEEQSLVLPGEGLALRQTVAGDTDQTYCFRVVWMEYTP